MIRETAIEMATSSIRYGSGVTREVGMDLAALDVRRVMLLVDPNLKGLPPVISAIESIEREGVHCNIFDRVKVEPTDESFREAIAFAQREPFDGFVAVG